MNCSHAGNCVVYVDSPEEVVVTAIDLAKNGMCDEYGGRFRLFIKPNDWKTIINCFKKSLESIIHAT